jgi:hypothetical protein
MTFDSAEEFFASIGADRHVPRLSRCRGSVRFDILSPDAVDSWRVDVVKGDVKVARDDSPAEAVVRADKAIIDGVVRGDVNPVAATLRGVMVVEGNWDLLLLLQRLFNDPALQAGRDPIEAETK